MPLAFASWNCISNNAHISWELVVFQNAYFLNDFSFNSRITILLPGWHNCHMLLFSFCQTVHEQASFLSSAVSSSMIIIISVARLASWSAFVRGRNTTIMCSISNKWKNQSDNASSILHAKTSPVFCHRSPSCTGAQGITCFITVPSSTWH